MALIWFCRTNEYDGLRTWTNQTEHMDVSRGSLVVQHNWELGLCILYSFALRSCTFS